VVVSPEPFDVDSDEELNEYREVVKQMETLDPMI
jgi:hypothetical protein